ncbi:MAG: AN1-type zinc finger domain-containing protein [Candidatus Heimdallarchaeaceae archaeon]
MKSCSVLGCEEEESLPFKCKLCDQMYCAKHRLPEQHDCPMIGIYQSEEYRKSKVSQPRTMEEKQKKTKPKLRGERLRSPRDTETKSVYYEPQDRFLSRSSFFNIQSLGRDYLSILIILFIFSIFITLNIIVLHTLYRGYPIATLNWNVVFINIGAINFIFGGHFVIQKIMAKNMKEETQVVLWVWGIVLGILSILLPLFAVPGFLAFKQGRSSNKNRGKIAFLGIAWILTWCTLIIIFLYSNGFGVPYLMDLSYAPSLMLLFVLFSLLPFGIYAGKYIRGWNRIVHMGSFLYTFVLFILYLIATY